MIRWISSSLGTAAFDEAATTPGFHCLDVRDLVDKEGNSRVAVERKIHEALEQIRQGSKVVICCDYGLSRSNAIAAGILAVQEGIAFDDALTRVLARTGETAIKLDVLSTVRNAVSSLQGIKTGARVAVGRPLLVTGSSGFIGSSLMPSLTENWKTVAPCHAEIDLTRDAVLLDQLVRREAISDILHLANPAVYTTNESLGTTLVMLKNVLDVCKQNGLVMWYVSSWEVYSGYTARDLRADEHLALRPGGTYGMAKAFCEQLIENYHFRYGLEYCILRSSPTYGPGSDRPKFIWNFIRKALRNEEIVTHEYRNGLPALDLLYATDLCRAIMAAIERGVRGIINIGTGVGITTSDVAHLIVEMIGSRSRVRQHRIEAYASNIIMDISQASATLGWCPRTTLSDGLDAIIRCVTASTVKDA